MTKCKICRAEFIKRSMLHKVCSPECAKEFAKRERIRKERVELVSKREQLKTRKQHLEGAQRVFNQYIRERDHDLPCISCQRYHAGHYHAGHYRSVGAAPQLRFDEDNCHKQCAPCNLLKSGNIVDYRINLVAKIGEEAVGNLESHRAIQRYTIADAIAKKAEYRAKLKELREMRKMQGEP